MRQSLVEKKHVIEFEECQGEIRPRRLERDYVSTSILSIRPAYAIRVSRGPRNIDVLFAYSFLRLSKLLFVAFDSVLIKSLILLRVRRSCCCKLLRHPTLPIVLWVCDLFL